MSPMFILISLCAAGHVVSQNEDVQNFTCEALRTVYQINNCCTQGCSAPPMMTSEVRKWNIRIKDVLEHRSGMLTYPPMEWFTFAGTLLTGYDVLEVQPIFDMMLEAKTNRWSNSTMLFLDYDGRLTVTQAILNKPLYGLFWPPGGPWYSNDDNDIVLAAIGVAAKNLGFPNVNSGAEYIYHKILAPLESTAWLAKGQLAAPSDLHEKLSELMVGRSYTFPPEYQLYTEPRDPNHVYIDRELVWASDVPNDGFVIGDRIVFFDATEKTNSTEDYLTGAIEETVAGTLQDFADVAKLVMRGGIHRKKDGTLVNVVSPEAINYAMKFYTGPYHPGEFPEGTWWAGYAPRVVWASNRFNGWGFSDEGEHPFLGDHDRLKRGRYVNIGTYGTAFCFDMGTGEFTINSATQIPPAAIAPNWFLRNDCIALGANQTQAQEIADAFVDRPSVSLLVGKMDDYEFFVYVGEMRKGERPTRHNLYYRWGQLGALLGRLAISAAFVDDKFMYEDEFLSKYIPQYGNLEAFTPGAPFGLCDPGVPCRKTCLPRFYPGCQLPENDYDELNTDDAARRRRSTDGRL